MSLSWFATAARYLFVFGLCLATFPSQLHLIDIPRNIPCALPAMPAQQQPTPDSTPRPSRCDVASEKKDEDPDFGTFGDEVLYGSDYDDYGADTLAYLKEIEVRIK